MKAIIKFLALLSIIALVVPALADDASWGSWVSLGNNVSSRVSAKLMTGVVTWEFRNDGPTTITFMDFNYTDKTGSHDDILPGSLKPGKIFGGWAAFTATPISGNSTETQIYIKLKTVKRAQ